MRIASAALTAVVALGCLTPAQAAQLGPLPRQIYPTRPLAWFPDGVRAACHAWLAAGWPAHDNWYALGRLGRVRGGRVYRDRGAERRSAASSPGLRTILPRRGVYHEYDVPGVGYHAGARGRLRFVRANQHGRHRLYYTDDHYADFREVRPAC